MDLIFLCVWSFLGLIYFIRLWGIDIPNKDKLRLVVLFGGPLVWIFKIGEFVLSAVKPLFILIDEWVKKE